jgi:hypothetical protein
LLLGTILLFVIAGFVESFISPTDLPPAVKFSVGAVGVIALWWWFSRGKETALPTLRLPRATALTPA